MTRDDDMVKRQKHNVNPLNTSNLFNNLKSMANFMKILITLNFYLFSSL